MSKRKEDQPDINAEEEVEAAEPPVKRGRGRPRTKPPGPPKENAPKKGRGRPPKQAKGRGRPPKVVAPVEDNDEVEEATGSDEDGVAVEPPAKKGRGRPKSKAKAPAKDPNAPKKGRGRPPKAKVAPVEEEVEEEAEESAE